MAKFLDTTGVSYHLEQIIKGASEKLVLISPYLKMNDRIKELLDDKDRLKLDVRLIYRNNELLPDEVNWLKTKNSIRTSFCKNLHAKCYVNEKEALITSMNLYDFSQANNNEMGIYVIRKEEDALYEEIHKEVNRLIRISEEVKLSVERVVKAEKPSADKVPPMPPKESPAKEKPRASEKTETGTGARPPEKGVCIRCKTELKLDPKHPLCKDCYVAWKKLDDEKHEEKYCHVCGVAHKTTLYKPTCYDCFRKFKDVLSFSA